MVQLDEEKIVINQSNAGATNHSKDNRHIDKEKDGNDQSNRTQVIQRTNDHCDDNENIVKLADNGTTTQQGSDSRNISAIAEKGYEESDSKYKERERHNREKHQEYLQHRTYEKHRDHSRERRYQPANTQGNSRYESLASNKESSSQGGRPIDEKLPHGKDIHQEGLPGSHRDCSRDGSRERQRDYRHRDVGGGVSSHEDDPRERERRRAANYSSRHYAREPQSSRSGTADGFRNSSNGRPPLPPAKDQANDTAATDVDATDASMRSNAAKINRRTGERSDRYRRGDGGNHRPDDRRDYPAFDTRHSRSRDYPDGRYSDRDARVSDRHNGSGAPGKYTNRNVDDASGDAANRNVESRSGADGGGGGTGGRSSHRDPRNEGGDTRGGDGRFGVERRRRREPVGEERSALPPRPDSALSHMTTASRTAPSMHGYPSYGDPYSSSSKIPRGGEAAGYDSQQYYYYYYSRYYDNPKYRDYYNSMMKHYQHQGPVPDERGSVRSGRSSVNDDIKKSAHNASRAGAAPLYDPYGLYQQRQQQHDTSSQFLGDFNERSSVGGYEPSSIYPPNQDTLYYPYSGSGRVSVELPHTPTQRLTPTMYPRPHAIARFTNTGQILMVLVPSSSSAGHTRSTSRSRGSAAATLQLLSVKDVLAGNEGIRRELGVIEAFPGPLTRQDTHKDVVVRFCESKQKHFSDSTSQDQTLSSSRQLLWQYLALLVRQNGKLCPADLAGLLVDSAGERKQRKVREEACGDGIAAGMGRMTIEGEREEDNNADREKDRENREEREDSASGASSHVNRMDDHSTDSNMNPSANLMKQPCNKFIPQHTAEELRRISDRITELVCLGRRREAIMVAVEGRLWGHAMAIGSRMDQTVGSRVLAAFMQTLAADDVMHTLVQQVNGKRPEVTKNYSSPRWGDWRRHLATLVANPSPQTSKDQAAVLGLGDSLSAAGDTAAGHLCYLISGVSIWGGKIQLLGIPTDQQQPLTDTTALLDGVQCTEVYEYGLSLAAGDVSGGGEQRLPGFQQHKLRYAATLAQYGYASQAVRYCEVITNTITQYHEEHSPDFLPRLHHLSNTTKYHHTHYQLGEGEVQDMPDPQWLAHLQVLLYEQQQKQKLLSLQQEQKPQQEQGTEQQRGPTIKQEDTEQHVPEVGQAEVTEHVPEVKQEAMSVADQPDGRYKDQVDHRTSVGGGLPPSSSSSMQFPSNYGMVPTQAADPGGHQERQDYTTQATPEASLDRRESVPLPPSQEVKQEVPEVQPNQHQQERPGDVASNTNVSQEQFRFQPLLMTRQQQAGGGGYGAEGGVNSSLAPSVQHQNSPLGGSYEESSAPASIMDYAKRGDTGYSNTAPSQQHSSPQYSASQQQYGLPSAPADVSAPPSPAHAPQQPAASTTKSSDADQATKDDSKTETSDNKGFLSRIFGWKNNQAKLPDDKNPAIVWDEARKRWVNTDGTEEVDTPLPPPPTSAALPPQLATANRAGNRKKSRYVNSLNPNELAKPAATITPPMPGSLPMLGGGQQQQGFMPMPSMQQQQPMPDMQQQTPMQPMNNIQQQQPMPNMEQQPMSTMQESLPNMQQQSPTNMQQQSPTNMQQPVVNKQKEALKDEVTSDGVTAGRSRSDSSSIEVDQASAAVQDEADSGGGQPMFFNPAQFQQQQQKQQQQKQSRGRGRGGPASNSLRRGGGPQRRAFQGAGEAPPPPRA